MSKKKRRGEDAGIEMQESKEMHESRTDDDGGLASRGFQKADESVLKTRVIRKAKRRLKPKASGGGVNPFANVNILASQPAAAPATTSGQFSFGGSSAAADTKEATSNVSQDAGAKTGGFSFGSSTAASSGSSGLFGSGSTSLFDKKTETASPGLFASKAPSTGGLFGSSSISTAKAADTSTDANASGGIFRFKSTPSAPSGLFSTSNGTSAQDKGDDYYSNIAALNKSFSKWVEKQDPRESWELGVADYIAYAENLKTDGTKEEKPMSNGLFGGSATSSSKASGLFGSSTLSNSAQAPAPAATDESNGQDGNEEEVIKVAAELGEDEEQLHQVRSKVMWFRDGAWSTKGTGQLTLLKQKSGSLRWLLMRTETTGRVSFNSPLFKGMNVTVDTKGKAVCYVGLSYKEGKDGLEVENDGKPAPIRLKVKLLEDAEKFAEVIKQNIPT